MKTPTLFKEYIWLINIIYRSGGISMTDINKAWLRTEMSDGVEFNKRTFYRHRQSIEEMFGIVIEIGKGYKYYIANSHVLKEDSVQNWLLSTLSVNNIIGESMSIQNRIFLESIPEVRHLELLVEAMKQNHKVIIAYQKYGSNESQEREIEPYFLKLHKRRWYVISNTSGGYRTFSFDRIVSAKMTEEKFKIEKDFDAKTYFADCFGVMKDERRLAQRIVLRAFGNEKHYMEDLPVHPSQKKIGEGEGYVDYEIFMRPTSDFLGYIQSRGSWVKVMEPQSVADEIKQNLLKTVELYS